MIPFLDIKAATAELDSEISEAVARVVRSGWYIGGEEVAAFEREWAEFCNAAYAVGTGNGLDALVLALRACGIKAGDGVILPSHTFIATWLAVAHIGAVPQPVEPDPRNMNIDVRRIEKAITPLTRAIVPVHLYGQPADLTPILQLAKEYDLRVVEDAAQAHGAKYKNERLGAHSDAVCWSFYPGKNLGAFGDAGAVTTNQSRIAEEIRRLGNYGSDEKYFHIQVGVNSRLDPIQAAVLRVKLKHLDAWNERRKTLSHEYTKILSEFDMILPQVPEWATPVWHLYVVRVTERDKLRRRLTEEGISTLVHYPIACHRQQAFSSWSKNSFPLADQLAKTLLSLPMGPHCPTDAPAQIAKVLKG